MSNLFLAGDVMPGRGIDQVLPRSVDPALHEPHLKDAREYVRLARSAGGDIPGEISYEDVWGDALDELRRARPEARIINLETAVTTSDDWDRGKGVHYRMHPGNVALLVRAGIDVCVLGNNHVLDWGEAGLEETLESLRGAGMATVGAGADQEEAAAPAVVELEEGRLLVFAWASPTAGVPRAWQAGRSRPGVNLLPHLGAEGAESVAEEVRRHRRAGDRVVASVHWGPNWGYDVPEVERAFARRLIELGAADVVYGHSSHHPRGIEVHRDRLILYGAGDFLNDYEGIGGRERYRGELTLMYFPELGPSGALESLTMTPMRIRDFGLRRAGREEAAWLRDTLVRVSEGLERPIELDKGGRLRLRAR